MKLYLGRILTVCLLLILCSTAFSATQSAMKIVSSTGSHLDLQFKMPSLDVKSLSNKDGAFQQYSLAGAELTSQTGMPSLPFYSFTIAIPAKGNVEYNVSNAKTRWLEATRPVPTQDKADVKADEWVLNSSFYNGTGVFPARTVDVSEPAILRDFRIVTVNLYPLQWDAASQRMKVVETADVRIDFTEGRGINELPGSTVSYSPIFSSLYEQMIDNFDSFRDDDMPPVKPRILMVYGNDTSAPFQTRINDLIAWKSQKGYLINAVSTATTGTSNTSIKAYILTQYNTPETRPDFIILLGDTSGSYSIPTWTETWSGYNGEGDYPYTKLAGNDELGDCFIGRISVENLSQLDNYLAKIYLMEKNINVVMPQAGWLDKLLLAGDPGASGVSTITTNIFIKELSKQVNPAYTYTEVYSGSFPNQMNSAINAGVGLMNYRGYLGMSGWSASGPFTNTNKLPHAVIITCGTGSFSSTASSETFIRQGTSANPTGGATAIGMATTGTHTGLNNCLTMGIFQGIYGNGMRTMGEALLAGRLNIEKLYGVSNASYAHRFAHWCNLMGDPTLEVFTGVPNTFTTNAPASLPAGSRQLELNVLDGTGTAVKYASVTAYITGTGVIASGFTDANGNILLNLPIAISGTLKITVAKHNFKPTQADITIDSAGSLVIDGFIFDDDNNGQSNGNGDFMLNAGETVECNITLHNTTGTVYPSVTGTITTTNPNVTIITGTASYPTIQAGATVNNSQPFVFSVVNDIGSSEDIRFTVTLSDGTDTWNLFYHVNAGNLRFAPAQITVVNGPDGVLDPGETAQLRVTLQNLTTLNGPGISAEISSLSDMVSIQDTTVVYGDILPNATATPQTNFVIVGRPQLIPGMLIPMRVRIFNSAGFNQMISFNLPIGTPSQHTPLGPDAYGHFIYDTTDTGFPDAPEYDWIEIAPALGGAGTSLNLSDEGTSSDEGDQDNNNKVAVETLPFPIDFYGVRYNQVSICTNGYISMGVTENHEFRNYRLPGAGGPSPMIAAFWDDLCTNGGGQVYKYFDATQHLYIVQYQNMKNGYNRTSEETFQIIFYDPAFYPSGLGDVIVKVQYKVFNNVDIGSTGYTPAHGNYCSIGIKNLNNTVGLEYTFNNVYPPAAAPLGNETAILITTIPVIHEAPYIVVANTYIQDPNNNGMVEPGDVVELGIQLSNLGTNPALNALLTVTETDQYVSVINDTTSYQTIPGSGTAMNDSPIVIQVSQDCPDNHAIVLSCHIAIAGNSWDRQVNLIVKKPNLTYTSFFINDYTANGNGMPDPGETFMLAINISNPSDLPATEVYGALLTTDPDVTINTPQATFGTIPPHTVIQKAYSVTFSYNVPFNSYVPFSLAFSGTMIQQTNVQLSVGCGISGLSMDFETNNGNLTPVEPNGWEWGSDTTAGAHSGTHVWGTVLGEDYPPDSHFELISPDAQVGPSSWLEFYQWYSMENGWDGGNVKVSYDNGQTWILVNPEGGYPDDTVSALAEAGFTGELNTWNLARFNLAPFAGYTIKVKWTFASDSGINGRGWYIDDVNFTGALTGTEQINGEVTLGDPVIPMANVVIGTDKIIATHPEPDGSYVIYLPPDTYDVTAYLPGYVSDMVEGVTLNPGIPVVTHDFYLAYLTPVRDIIATDSGENIHLEWTVPQEPEFPVVNYKMYQRYNTGGFELLTQTTLNYIDTPVEDNGQYQFYLIVNYGVGESLPSNILTVEMPFVHNQDEPVIPIVTELKGNYPNPFNPNTTIAYDLSKDSKVSLQIYNIKGQLVKTLLNDYVVAGRHNLVWNGLDNNGKSVSSGMYLYRMETGYYFKTMKAMLLK